MTKINARMIDETDKLVTIVQVDDLNRKAGQEYARRSVIVRGKKFMEPAHDALEFVGADEWHEVPKEVLA